MSRRWPAPGCWHASMTATRRSSRCRWAKAASCFWPAVGAPRTASSRFPRSSFPCSTRSSTRAAICPRRRRNTSSGKRCRSPAARNRSPCASPMEPRSPPLPERSFPPRTSRASTPYRPASQRFVVNLAPDESRLAPLPPDRLTSLGVPLRTEHETPTQIARREGQAQAIEIENQQKLWRWALVTALGVLLLETLFAGKLSRTSGSSTVAPI